MEATASKRTSSYTRARFTNTRERSEPRGVSEANLADGWVPDGFAGRAGRARALPVY
jgi:hypothetical protein